MKLLVRGLIGIVVLAGVALLAVYLNLGRIIKTETESEGTASLRLNTTLGSARLAIFGGKLDLHDLSIGSPKGFSAPKMFELGNVGLDVDYDELRKQPIHVKSLTLDKPRLVIEQSNGTLNFKQAMDLQPAPAPKNKEPMKLVIDELKVNDAHVIIHPGLPGIAQEIDIPVPSLAMKNVGSGPGSKNGAAIKDVTMQVITALAGKAAASGQIPPELQALLHLNTAQVATALGLAAAKQIGANIPGGLGQKLSQDPQGLAKDPSKALQVLFAPSGKSAPAAAHR